MSIFNKKDKNNYIQIEKIKRIPDAELSTQQEKEARIYALAEKMKVKIGAKE